MYIVIYRVHHRDPFVLTDYHDFLETFTSYEDAIKAAEGNTGHDDCYHDYEIFEEATR